MLRRALLLLTCWVLVASATSAEAPIGVEIRARSFRPGELIVFTVTAPSATDVRVSLFNHTVGAYRLDATRWQAIVGIDLDQRPGEYRAQVQAIDGQSVATENRAVTIVRRAFPTRTLRVAPDYVNPPPETMTRIEQEQAFTREVFAHPAPTRLWTGPFVRPVPQAANSRFGTRSVYNGEPRSPHGGADFLSPAGQPVRAPNRGRIVCARELFFTGNTVIVDHGMGLFSLMAHLSRIDVKEGDEVDSGRVLGLVGATGRVTGPHLHWAVTVSGARVDPLSVLALLGANGAAAGP